MEPQLIEQHSLPRSLPQRLDLFFLPAHGKGLVLDTECNEAFEAIHLGITEASLPLHHRSPGNPQPLAQARLCQPDACAQREHQLPEGIVSLSIRRCLHGRSPFRVTHRSAPPRSDEKCHVSSWTVTSPGSISILKLSGVSPSGSTPFSVIWVMPIDLRSPLHFSTSMIADLLADHEPLVSGPGRKKVLSRVPALCFFRRNPVAGEMRSDGQ